VKQNLKPYAYNQSEHKFTCDGVLFVERTGELPLACQVKAEEGRSRSESESKKGAISTLK
jgi:sensor domain CHASE-containing protein